MSTGFCPSSLLSSSPCSPYFLSWCSPTLYPAYSLFPCKQPGFTNVFSAFSFPSWMPSQCLCPSCFFSWGRHLFQPKQTHEWCYFSSWCTQECFLLCFLPFWWPDSWHFAFSAGLLPFPVWFSFHFFPFSIFNLCSFRFCFRQFFPLFLKVSIFGVLLLFCLTLSAVRWCRRSTFSTPNSILSKIYFLFFFDAFISDLLYPLYFILLVLYFSHVSFLMEFHFIYYKIGG